MRFVLRQPLCINEIGSRPNQEDSVYPAPGIANVSTRLFMVCDGMGGHQNGEVASSTVCGSLPEFIRENIYADEPLTEELFDKALDYAYHCLDSADTSGADDKKMGTTMTFVCFHAGGCMAAHIGDSRIYHFRPSENPSESKILYKSRDHSLLNDLVKLGEISEEEAAASSSKNVITRCMMPKQDNPSPADIVNITNIRGGDYFFLCSDGILENFDDNKLLQLICSDNLDEEKIEILRELTLGNKDNHSAYLIPIEEVIYDNGEQIKEEEIKEEEIKEEEIKGDEIPSDSLLTSNVVETAESAISQSDASATVQSETSSTGQSGASYSVIDQSEVSSSDSSSSKRRKIPAWLIFLLLVIAIVVVGLLYQSSCQSKDQPATPQAIEEFDGPKAKMVE